MGVMFRYLAMESEGRAALDWFRELAQPPSEFTTPRGAILHFANLGPLVEAPGSYDAKASPVVNVFVPRKRRGVLLTAGEVHFLSTPLRKRFPVLHEIKQGFERWLGQCECVFSQSSTPGEWDYYLEGSLRSYDSDIFALPDAMAALRRGQYFVSDDDNDFVVDRLCRSLRLRGVEGIVADTDKAPGQ